MASIAKPLTPKQEAFAQAVASGMTQSDAYRKAYDAGRMSDQSVWVQASEILANHKVAVRVDELRSKLAVVTEKKALWNKEMSVKVLANIAVRGKKEGDKIRAIAELNKMHGWHAPQQVEVRGSVDVTATYDYSQLDESTLWALQRAKLPPA